MAHDFRVYGGLLSSLPSLANREPGYTTDQPRLYVGNTGLGNTLLGVLKKINATAAPTVNDDAGDGYSVGSVWTDTTNDKSYICSDSTVGAAVWQQFSGTGASGDIQTLLDGISTTQGVILYYNGTDWVALATGTAGQYLRTGGAGANPSWSSTGGDLSGVPSAATVAKINGVALGSTTATDKNILIADGSQWVTRAVSGDVTITNTGAATVVSASDTAAGKIEIAVQSEMETGTDTTRAVVPGRQQYHASACKCWVTMKYNGVGVTNTASYNVSSVGYTSPGIYTVTIDTDFSSANYAIVQGIEHHAGTGNRLVNWYDRAAGSFGAINTNQTFSTPADAQLHNDFACFGDQ